MYECALESLRSGVALVPLSELNNLRKRIRESERLLGKKTMEIEILRDALEIAH